MNLSLKFVPGKNQAGNQTCTEKVLSVMISWRKTISQAQNDVYKFSKCKEISPVLGSHSKVRLESMIFLKPVMYGSQNVTDLSKRN